MPSKKQEKTEKPIKEVVNDKKEKKVKVNYSTFLKTELVDESKRLRKEIDTTRLTMAVGKETNLKKKFNLRKNLARVMTQLYIKSSEKEDKSKV